MNEYQQLIRAITEAFEGRGRVFDEGDAEILVDAVLGVLSKLDMAGPDHFQEVIEAIQKQGAGRG